MVIFGLYFLWKCPAQACSQWFAPQKALAPSRYNWFDGKSPVWWFGTVCIFPYVGNSFPNWLSYFSEGYAQPPTSHPNSWPFSHGVSHHLTFHFHPFSHFRWHVWSPEAFFFCGGVVTIQNGWLVEMTRIFLGRVSTNWKKQALNHDRPS